MQHLTEFLNVKKLNIIETLKYFCEVTEKIDGNALQIYNDNNNLIFGKRGENPYKKSANTLTEIDLLLNSMYYNVYTYLNKYKHIIEKYKILNFEIFSTDPNINSHIIKYDNVYDNNIVLLSGLSLDNKVLTNIELNKIAKQLQVSTVNVLWKGNLTDEMIENIIKYKNDEISLWNYITELFNLDKQKFIEGIVLTFKDEDNNVKRILKVQNPDFHKQLMEHLNNELKEKNEKNLEKYFNFIIKSTILNKESFESNAKILLKLYTSIESENKDLSDIEKSLEIIPIFKNLKINTLLATEIYEGFPDNIKYPCLLNFILLGFMHKRKRFPLWCSKEYQDNILNPFIDKLFS